MWLVTSSYGTSIIASETSVQKKQEMIRRFVGTVARTWKYAESRPEEAIDALVKTFPEMNRTALLTELKIFMPLMKSAVTEKRGWGAMETARWETDITHFYQQEVIKKKIDVDSCFANDFVGR